MADAHPHRRRRRRRTGDADAAGALASLTTSAIVCTVRAHGEHGAILRALTAEAGLVAGYVRGGRSRRVRSEEHTSELQSLMRSSYAAFCLKKKKKKRLNQR